MKALRHLCAALALTFVLALPAFAGQMDAGITAPPPPPQGNMSTTVAGNMTTGDTDTATAMEVALSLLQSLLSLF
jgi:hypothetical protein